MKYLEMKSHRNKHSPSLTFIRNGVIQVQADTIARTHFSWAKKLQTENERKNKVISYRTRTFIVYIIKHHEENKATMYSNHQYRWKSHKTETIIMLTIFLIIHAKILNFLFLLVKTLPYKQNNHIPDH